MRVDISAIHVALPETKSGVFGYPSFGILAKGKPHLIRHGCDRNLRRGARLSGRLPTSP
jgi:hypothetical protein